MDRTDNQILKLLLENARISLSDISSRVNLSVSAISERLKKLESSGLIDQYTTILNPKALHCNLTVIMLVTFNSLADIQEFNDFVASEPSIIEYYLIAGGYDGCLKIVTEDTESLEDLLNRLRRIPVVSKTQTNVALSAVKRQHSVLPPERDF